MDDLWTLHGMRPPQEPGDTPLAQLIRQARTDAGMTMRELGELIGASESQVSRVEKGERGLSWHKAVRAATALGLDVDAVLEAAGLPEEAPPADEYERVVSSLPLTPRQRQHLLDTYRTFMAANAAAGRRRGREGRGTGG